METNTHQPTRVPITHEPMRGADPVHAFVSGPVACRYLYFPQPSSERTTRREFRGAVNGLRVPGVLPLVPDIVRDDTLLTAPDRCWMMGRKAGTGAACPWG